MKEFEHSKGHKSMSSFVHMLTGHEKSERGTGEKGGELLSRTKSISDRLNRDRRAIGGQMNGNVMDNGMNNGMSNGMNGQMQQQQMPTVNPFNRQQPQTPMKKGGKACHGKRREKHFLGAAVGTLAPAAIEKGVDYVKSGNLKRDINHVGNTVSKSAQGWKKMLGFEEGGRAKKDFGGTMNKIGQGVKNIDGNVASAAKNVGNKIASGAKNFGSNVAKGAEVVGGHARNIGNKIADGAKSFGKALGFEEGGEVRKKRGAGGMMGRRMGMMQKIKAPVAESEMLTTKSGGGRARHAMGGVGKIRKDEY